MRAKLIISAAVLALVGITGPAVANIFAPGRIIIGYTSGGGTIGTTTNAMVGPGCILEQPVECDCWPGATVLDACLMEGVDIACLTPDMAFIDIIQKEPVVQVQGKPVLGAVMCTGKSDDTANIILPKPKG